MIYKYNGETVDRETLVYLVADEIENNAGDDYADYIKQCNSEGFEPLEMYEWSLQEAENRVSMEEEDKPIYILPETIQVYDEED